MKRFKFNKPLVESPNPPQTRDVLWVDVDEITGEVKSIKENKNNEWKDFMKSSTTKLVPPNNEIWYRTVDGLIYDYEEKFNEATDSVVYSGPALISNTWDEEKQLYVLKFDKEITSMGMSEPGPEGKLGVFLDITTFSELYLPESITDMGYLSCMTSSSLSDISLLQLNIPSKVTTIKFSFGMAKTIVLHNSVSHIQNTSVGCHYIIYNGTKEQWEAIEKESEWLKGIDSTISIYCTNGVIIESKTPS